LKYLALPLILLLLSACTNELAKIENDELRKRAYRCLIATNQTPAEIQVCKNLHRECERRRNEGNYAC
jgi:hypothetical protein